MNFKNVLPFENYILKSKLSVDDVLKRLGDNIQKEQGFGFSNFNNTYTKPYSGQISGMTFKMSRNINYRNSFLPVITGQISTHLGHTQISIIMRPVLFVLIFISLWFCIVGLVCVSILIAGLLQFKQVLLNGFSPMLLIPYGMLVFGCLLTYFAFKGESKKSIEFLTSLFESSESE